MADINISLTVPASWLQLDRRKAVWLLKMIAHNPDMSPFRLKALAFLRFSGMTVLAKSNTRDEFLVQTRDHIFSLDPERFSACVDSMEWITTIPAFPWRPDRLAWGKPRLHDLSDLSFGDWLQLENLYAGYLHTSDDRLLRQMGSILVGRRWRPFKDWELVAIFNWHVAVKDLMMRKFPDFFSGVAGDEFSLGPAAVSAKALQDAMDAQIRALTKGDIAKEELILSMPCHRALTELNALAREYQDLKSKMDK